MPRDTFLRLASRYLLSPRRLAELNHALVETLHQVDLLVAPSSHPSATPSLEVPPVVGATLMMALAERNTGIVGRFLTQASSPLVVGLHATDASTSSCNASQRARLGQYEGHEVEVASAAPVLGVADCAETGAPAQWGLAGERGALQNRTFFRFRSGRCVVGCLMMQVA